MKTASETKVSQINTIFKDDLPEGAEKAVAIHLRTVANAFIQAQQRRNDADYNMAKEWTPVEVETQIASVNEAFKTWSIIRDEAVAQAYLVSLLGSRHQRTTAKRAEATESQNRTKKEALRSRDSANGARVTTTHVLRRRYSAIASWWSSESRARC